MNSLIFVQRNTKPLFLNMQANRNQDEVRLLPKGEEFNFDQQQIWDTHAHTLTHEHTHTVY